MNSEISTKPLRILLAEDHEWSRIGLSMSLEAKCDFKIVGEAENGEQAVSLAREQQPDVILMDIEMPVMSGITATCAIKKDFPDIKIIMLTSHRDELNISQALLCGASAYCMKDIKIERLVQVVEMVADGATWFDPGISELLAKILLRSISNEPSQSLPVSKERCDANLTDRELDVLELIVKGKSNRDIAEALCITVNTVKIHVGNVLKKLQVEDRTQLAVKALQERLLSSDGSR